MSILERKQEFPIKLKHPTHRPPIIEMILALTAQSLEWTDSRTKLSRSRSQSPRAGVGVGCCEAPEPRGTPGRDYWEIGSLANWEKCKRYFRQIDRKCSTENAVELLHMRMLNTYFVFLQACKVIRSVPFYATLIKTPTKHCSFLSPEVNQYK